MTLSAGFSLKKKLTTPILLTCFITLLIAAILFAGNQREIHRSQGEDNLLFSAKIIGFNCIPSILFHSHDNLNDLRQIFKTGRVSGSLMFLLRQGQSLMPVTIGMRKKGSESIVLF